MNGTLIKQDGKDKRIISAAKRLVMNALSFTTRQKNTSRKQSSPHSLWAELRQAQLIWPRHSSEFHLALRRPVNSWVGGWVKGHFPRLLKQILAWKRSAAMREKGHQNWPLVIRPRYDPHLPFSGRSVSKPWSKRDTSPSIPPLRGMSVPHCPAAITSCEPGSCQTKACLFLLGAEEEMQHIFMRLSAISCFILMKGRTVSSQQRWNTRHQKWFAAAAVLSGGVSGYVLMPFTNWLHGGSQPRRERTHGIIDGMQTQAWCHTNKSNSALISQPSVKLKTQNLFWLEAQQPQRDSCPTCVCSGFPSDAGLAFRGMIWGRDLEVQRKWNGWSQLKMSLCQLFSEAHIRTRLASMELIYAAVREPRRVSAASCNGYWISVSTIKPWIGIGSWEALCSGKDELESSGGEMRVCHQEEEKGKQLRTAFNIDAGKICPFSLC